MNSVLTSHTSFQVESVSQDGIDELMKFIANY